MANQCRTLAVLGALLALSAPAAFPQPATAYDFSKLRRERLGRGVVAFRSGEREAVGRRRQRKRRMPGRNGKDCGQQRHIEFSFMADIVSFIGQSSHYPNG